MLNMYFALCLFTGFDILFLEVCNYLIIKLKFIMYYAKDIGNFSSEWNTIPKQKDLLKIVGELHIEILDYLIECNDFYQINIFLSYNLNTSLLCLYIVVMGIVS